MQFGPHLYTLFLKKTPPFNRLFTVYRPGSATVQQLFVNELSAVFEQLATCQAPIYIAGDQHLPRLSG